MNAIVNFPLLAKMILVLLTVLSIWLLSRETNQEIPLDNSKQVRETDYTMTDFTLTIMNESGLPSRIIQGKTMQHFPKGDRSEITLPVAQIIDADNNKWQFSAEQGTIQGKGDQITLVNNVIVSRQQPQQIELHSEKLTLDLLHNSAYTDLATRIISPAGQIDSVGLHASFDDSMLNLHSQVKGQYHAPNSP